MNSHSKVRAVSLLSLSIAVAMFGAIPASNAATKATTKPKVAAKTTPKPTPKASAKVTAKANPKITKLPAVGASGRGGRFANLTTAQRACLVKNGVTIPAPRTGTARPTPNSTRSPRAFTGTPNTFNNAKTTAAFKKCGVAMATGGFGGGTFNSAKFQAFTKCMTTAGFQSTGGFGRYDQSDPSTVAALIKCQKSTGFTLPKPGQPGTN